MSEEHTESNNPAGSVIGAVFLFLIPVFMIAMLGIVGVAFLKGMKSEDDPAAETAAPAASSAATPPPAAPASPGEGAPATAEGEAAGEPGSGSEGDVDPAVMALGQTAYATCAACHGPDGKGIQAGPALMAPSLLGSEILLGDPELPLLIVLKGIQKENMDYMGAMMPLGAALDDQKLAAVLTYTRNNWGNSASPVTPEKAAEARAKYADLDAPTGIKRDRIEEIVAAHE
ncbi:MAG: cytochrome c [Verrucomicrobiales bacterium]